MPDISIITPSFRQVDLLALCAASVLDQVGEVTVEHIVQDNLTGKTFQKWAANQAFAQCHEEPDHGMYDAINRGFRRARGEIVAWLNCDEQYLPGALEKVVRYFASHPETDILFGDVIVADSSFQPRFYRKAVKPMPGLIQYGFLPTFSAATFIRRRMIDEGQLLEASFKAIADAEWIHRLLKHGYRMAVIDEPIALFLLTGSNLGQSPAALAESAKWRRSEHPRTRLLAMIHRQIHRLRKVLAGSYRMRQINTAIYLPDHVERQQIVADIGGVWSDAVARSGLSVK